MAAGHHDHDFYVSNISTVVLSQNEGVQWLATATYKHASTCRQVLVLHTTHKIQSTPLTPSFSISFSPFIMFHRILYSTLSLLSAFLVLLLLPWFVRFRCVPGLFAIAWLFVLDVLYGLNPLILGNGLPDTTGARAYCDIGESSFCLLRADMIYISTSRYKSD